MNIAIVDDDKDCLEEMEKLCLDYREENGCHMELFFFSSGEAFLESLADTAFSIVFMDIYMKGMNGISAAKKLRKTDISCILIFLTTSMEFMPEAFSCHAFEYLLKPVRREQAAKALDDALKLLPPPQKFIEVISGRKSIRIFLHEIISVMTDAHYLEISLADHSAVRTRMTVSGFLTLADRDSRFILANRGILLNAEHIQSFEDNCCILDNGEQIPLRVRDAGRVEQAVRDYNFEMIRRRQRITTRRN